MHVSLASLLLFYLRISLSSGTMLARTNMPGRRCCRCGGIKVLLIKQSPLLCYQNCHVRQRQSWCNCLKKRFSLLVPCAKNIKVLTRYTGKCHYWALLLWTCKLLGVCEHLHYSQGTNLRVNEEEMHLKESKKCMEHGHGQVDWVCAWLRDGEDGRYFQTARDQCSKAKHCKTMRNVAAWSSGVVRIGARIRNK